MTILLNCRNLLKFYVALRSPSAVNALWRQINSDWIPGIILCSIATLQFSFSQPAEEIRCLSCSATMERHSLSKLLQGWYRTEVRSQEVVFPPSIRAVHTSKKRFSLGNSSLALSSWESLKPIPRNVPMYSNLSPVFQTNKYVSGMWKVDRTKEYS